MIKYKTNLFEIYYEEGAKQLLLFDMIEKQSFVFKLTDEDIEELKQGVKPKVLQGFNYNLVVTEKMSLYVNGKYIDNFDLNEVEEVENKINDSLIDEYLQNLNQFKIQPDYDRYNEYIELIQSWQLLGLQEINSPQLSHIDEYRATGKDGRQYELYVQTNEVPDLEVVRLKKSTEVQVLDYESCQTLFQLLSLHDEELQESGQVHFRDDSQSWMDGAQYFLTHGYLNNKTMFLKGISLNKTNEDVIVEIPRDSIELVEW